MDGQELGRRTSEELGRLVSALGRHRYVAGRLHLVHAFVFEALGPVPGLEEAYGWATTLVREGQLDLDSKDPRLYRNASDAELCLAFANMWVPERPFRSVLVERLLAMGVPIPPKDAPAFDEAREEDTFPVLIDAGWELLPLSSLDPEKHAGAIGAFGDELTFASAKFEEQNAVPPTPSLHELPVFGPAEVLASFAEDGRTREPFVLWGQGHPDYLGYLLRGITRAAKLEDPEEPAAPA